MKDLSNCDYQLEIWEFYGNIEIQITLLENGSLEQSYMSVHRNNCTNTFLIKSPKSEFVSVRLQSQ